MVKTFVSDPELGELAKMLKKAVDNLEMRYDDAIRILKEAIKKSISEKAQVIKDDSIN